MEHPVKNTLAYLAMLFVGSMIMWGLSLDDIPNASSFGPYTKAILNDNFDAIETAVSAAGEVTVASNGFIIGSSGGSGVVQVLSGDILSTPAGVVTIQDRAVDVSDLPAIAAGQMLVGNDADSNANVVTLSGDVVVSTGGVATIQDRAVDRSDLPALTAGQIFVGNSADSNVNAVTLSADLTVDTNGVATIPDNSVLASEVGAGTFPSDNVYSNTAGTIYTGEASVDGKYGTVGPDATTGLMLEAGTVALTAGGTVTQAFTAVFGAAPNVVGTYADDPGNSTNVNIALYFAATTSNFLATGVASKNLDWVAVGQRP